MHIFYTKHVYIHNKVTDLMIDFKKIEQCFIGYDMFLFFGEVRETQKQTLFFFFFFLIIFFLIC